MQVAMDQNMADIESQTIINGRVHRKSLDISQNGKSPVILKFSDVVYKIKTKRGRVIDKNRKKEEKIILNGVTGIVEPGEMVAMLGPSGSGKTTLLTALGGRLIEGKLQGTITYNGKPFSNAIKKNTGFVTQDDVLYPHLTVTETLVFTALLRLPNSVTKQEKILHAKGVIDQLGLTKCKDIIVGCPNLRGVSGGERKRVSIGQEMLINPSLLFLDEPTSGLDSTTAQRIVSTLWDLASGGRTIVMTIHQPSSRLYYMFHKVLLLSEGNVLYFGKGSEAIDYFSHIGYAPAMAMNPSDFLLDLANGVYINELNEEHGIDKHQLLSAYKSNIEPELKLKLQEMNDFSKSQCEIEDRVFGKWATSWSQQFIVLSRRYIKEKKYESFSALRIFQLLVSAVIAGLLWYKSDISHLQDQIGLLFFISGFWGFAPLFQAIFTFPQEIMMLQKERSSGMYRLSSYFMSRVLSDLPMELTLPTIFLVITYWLAGLKPNMINFLYTLFSLLLHVLTSQGLGLAIGAIVLDQKSATTLATIVMLCFSLAAGFYVQHMPKFVAWVKYISINYYTYKLFIGSQYHIGERYPCPNGECAIEDFPSIKQMGFPNLHEQAIAVLVLGIMLIAYRLIAYFALMRIGVTKKLA